MENVAYALRMAAAVLIALLLTSLLIFTFSQISNIENSKEEKKITEQTTEFNNKFLAFDKTSMYGTDVISVLGLAISNNKIANASVQANPDGRYLENVENSINIRIKLKTEVVTVTTKTTYEIKSGETVQTSKEETNKNSVLQKNKTYSLEVQNDDDKQILEILDKIATAGNANVSRDEKKSNYGKTIIVTSVDLSGFNDFKKAIFECTEIKQNGAGRINCMTFEEKSDSDR